MNLRALCKVCNRDKIIIFASYVYSCSDIVGGDPYAKSSNPERIKSNLDVVCGGWLLDDNDMAALDSLSTQCRMVDGSFWLSPFGPYKTLTELWDDDDEEEEEKAATAA